MLVRRETIIPSLTPDFFLSLICGANSSIDCKIKITIEVGTGLWEKERTRSWVEISFTAFQVRGSRGKYLIHLLSFCSLFTFGAILGGSQLKSKKRTEDEGDQRGVDRREKRGSRRSGAASIRYSLRS